jgi:hypothetical protein
MQVTAVTKSFGSPSITDSFLIQAGGTNLLFDCGFDVFPKLLSDSEVLRSIDVVFISKMHDRYMGSLRSLLKYKFDNFGQITKVIASGSVREWLLNYLSDRGFYGISKRKGNWAEVMAVTMYATMAPGVSLYPTKGWGDTPTYGLYISEHNSSGSVSIVGVSGPTRAVPDFENAYNVLRSMRKPVCQFTLLHDLGGAGAPSMDVHAYKDELKGSYSDDFISKLSFYNCKQCYNKTDEGLH